MNKDSILDKYDEMDCAEVRMSFSEDGGQIIREIVKSADDKIVGVSENIPLAEYNKESPMQSYCLKLVDERIGDADTFIKFKSIVEGEMQSCPIVEGFEVRNTQYGVFGAWRLPSDYDDEGVIGGIYTSEVERVLDAILFSPRVSSLCEKRH